MYSASASSTIGPQPVRVEDDLVLAHHAADRGGLGDVRQRLQLVLEEPVLDRAQLAEIVATRAIDERILVDPADPGRVRPERGLRLGRQPRLHLVEVLEHARARPVWVGAVLEQDVDERVAEERVAAHRLRARDRQHRRRQRVGDLVLDDARRLARISRADDDLHVREIGDRVERGAQDGVDAPRRDERGRHQHEEPVRDRPADEVCDHGADRFGTMRVTT
jgi:hypothetical protein